MDNKLLIKNLNNLINAAIGCGELRSYYNDDDNNDVKLYENTLVDYIHNILELLEIEENYDIINTNNVNVIPDILERDIWTDNIIVTKDIKNELIKYNENKNNLNNRCLVLKLDSDDGQQELWKRII